VEIGSRRWRDRDGSTEPLATPNGLALLYGTVPSSNDSILSVVIVPKAMYSKNERGKLDAAVKYSETLGGERGEGDITIVN
jgi:hypothetical protein